MRILVISDIHSNQPALEAVLKDAGDVDAIWCLGDIVGYGPFPNECIDRLRNLPDLVALQGNHDAGVLDRLSLTSFNHDAGQAIEWTRSLITKENLEFLSSLKQQIVIGEVTLNHGSPRNPIWEYLMEFNTIKDNFSYYSTPYSFVGHTHIPILYHMDENGTVEWKIPPVNECIPIPARSFVNPGSVGQPRNHDIRAAYALFYPAERLWEARRVEYDISKIQEKIRSVGLPPRHAMRLEEGW